MNPPTQHAAHGPIIARLDLHPEGAPRGFVLAAGDESSVLAPGQSWMQVDHYKWVTRGLMEPPQSFHVAADGTVDLNGESFSPQDPGAAERLTRLLNARHAAQPPPRPPTPSRRDESSLPQGVTYHVRLDPYGHLLIRAARGSDHTETGMRGLAHLAAEGWTRPFRSLHVDPLQRYIELNGTRYEPTPAGVAALEAFLNTECAPPASALGANGIEIRENPASSTGYDIAFFVHRAGARTEIHGHLNQETLDSLQDGEHCDLLQPGVVLRLAPPFLYFRRRRPDGGEVPIPELGDVKYRSTTAAQLQQFLNHPAIRRGGGNVPTVSAPADPAPAASPPPPTPVAPPLPPPLPKPSLPALPPAPPRLEAPAPVATQPTALPSPRPLPPPFLEPRDTHLIHQAVFHALATSGGHQIQDLRLSLDRVFEDRRFEIIEFDDLEVSNVLQLRGAAFHGAYLVHLSHDRLDLVYAKHGVHFEWGTDRCLIQPTPGAESIEYGQPALLGLGQLTTGAWAFVVTPHFREWSRRYDPAAEAAEVAILDPHEALAHPSFRLLWPSDATPS